MYECVVPTYTEMKTQLRTDSMQPFRVSLQKLRSVGKNWKVDTSSMVGHLSIYHRPLWRKSERDNLEAVSAVTYDKNSERFHTNHSSNSEQLHMVNRWLSSRMVGALADFFSFSSHSSIQNVPLEPKNDMTRAVSVGRLLSSQHDTNIITQKVSVRP